MLRLIRIRNLALIRELEIEFGRGLNLLTGETGSGKSILVDALGLLLGERSSQEMIRSDCDSAVVEGVFEIASSHPVAEMLLNCGFEPEDGMLLIRREIASSGRNRAYINNNLANVSLLKSIGGMLADIHGQQDQATLLDLTTHLEWLDDFGGNELQVRKVTESYRKLQDTVLQIEALQTDEQARLRRIDMLQYQIEEIRNVNPQPGEKEALENEQSFLTNREKIVAMASEAYAMLYENESSILREISHIERLLGQLESFDRNWSQYQETLRDCRYKLEDLAYSARDYAADTDFNPARLEQVEQRLFALEKLTKKYGASCTDIIDYLDRCTRELDELVSYAESSERLAQQLQGEAGIYLGLARELSEKRRKDARALEIAIQREFAALAMERMEMRVYFKPNDESESQGHLPGFYGLNGIDHVEFLIAPNKGEEMKPLAKIASGGELSRLMLAIRSVCGGDDRPVRTLVFDEVDTGIGGRVAEAVGKRLRDIARQNQVLCVTHLPQVAAFASHHFTVEKKVAGGRTETVVKCLADSERVQELSRMLGGENLTPATRRLASEMIEHSRETRK